MFSVKGNVFSALLTAVFLAGMFGLTGSAGAQGFGQEFDLPEPPQAQASEFTDAEIVAFARANSRIADIQHKYNEELMQATDPEEQQNIMERANQEVLGIIEEEGISIDTFNDIASEAQADPALVRRIQEAMYSMM